MEADLCIYCLQSYVSWPRHNLAVVLPALNAKLGLQEQEGIILRHHSNVEFYKAPFTRTVLGIVSTASGIVPTSTKARSVHCLHGL